MEPSHSLRPSGRFRLMFHNLLAFVLMIPAAGANAQEMRGLAVEGYVTAVHLPTGFEVNGESVVLKQNTGYGLQKDKVTHPDSPLRDAVQVGAYVYVLGKADGKNKTATARAILFRDDWDKKLSGAGVIEKVVSRDAETTYQADGYLIRITPSTVKAFRGNLKTLSDVAPNVLLSYQGMRDKDGVLTATKAAFIQVKASHVQSVKGLETSDPQLEPPDFASGKSGSVKTSVIGGWRTIPADQQMQERIQRIGLKSCSCVLKPDGRR